MSHLITLKKYYRSEWGMIVHTHKQQRRASKARGHEPPSYTKEELYDWFWSQECANDLYLAWKNSDFNRWLRPSVDRIDSDKGYSLDNIELVTWKENRIRFTIDQKKGKNYKPARPVIQYSINGNFIKEYPTIQNAVDETNVHYSGIMRCCQGKFSQSGGFQWHYKK